MRVALRSWGWCGIAVLSLALMAGALPAQTDENPATETTPAKPFPDEDAPATQPTAPASPESANTNASTEDDITNWQDASSEEELGQQIRSSVIEVGPDGLLQCSLFRIDHETREEILVKQIEVTLLSNGKSVETKTPDPETGVIEFGPLSRGIYSLIGNGTDGFAAFSFIIDKEEDENAENAEAKPESEGAEDNDVMPAEKPTVQLIHSTTLEPRDTPMALQLIRAFVDGGGIRGSSEEGETEPSTEEEEMAKSSDEDAPFHKIRHDAEAVLSTSIKWHTVQLRPEGMLVGRILLLAEMNEEGEVKAIPPKDMQVFVIKEGQVISRATCNDRGSFSFPDLAADLYSFVGVGQDGFVALTVDVLPAENPQQEEEVGVQSASFRRVAFQNAPNTLNIFTNPVPPSGTQYISTPIITTPETNPTDAGELPITMFGADTPSGGNPSMGGSSGVISPGGAGGGMTAPPGGFGGGGGGGGTDGNTQVSVPEIDPASSGVGLSVLIGLLLLLVDLYRPR